MRERKKAYGDFIKHPDSSKDPSREQHELVVIKMPIGKKEIIRLTLDQALEALTQFGIADARTVLENSSADSPIKAGNFWYWLNNPSIPKQ